MIDELIKELKSTRIYLENTWEIRIRRALVLLLERERDRKKEIRLEALTLLEEMAHRWHSPGIPLYPNGVQLFVNEKRKEIEGT